MEVLPFGEERIDIISSSRLEELRNKYEDPFKFAYAVFRDIYFNNKAGFNRNVRFVEGDHTTMMVWTGTSWKQCSNVDVFHDMFVTFEKVKALHEDTNQETMRAILLMERRIKF